MLLVGTRGRLSQGGHWCGNPAVSPTEMGGPADKLWSRQKARQEGPGSGDARSGSLKSGESNGQEGLQARAWGHSGLHCPPAMVFLWPQIRGSPDVKRKACHPLLPGSSCPEAALCIPPRPSLPNSHWGPASCLPGPQSGSHRYTQNNPRGSLHTSDAHCLCWALSFLLHGSLCVPIPGGITSHSHARPAWLLSLPTWSFYHLRQSYRRPRVTRVNHR